MSSTRVLPSSSASTSFPSIAIRSPYFARRTSFTQFVLHPRVDLSRRALEAFALEEYKAERLSKAELRRVLGISRYALDGFLKAHDIWIDYTLDDFHLEMDTLKRLGF
jgi:hypothetical protein